MCVAAITKSLVDEEIISLLTLLFSLRYIYIYIYIYDQFQTAVLGHCFSVESTILQVGFKADLEPTHMDIHVTI